MKESGNRYISSDILRILFALKRNIMKDTNVADVCKVKAFQDGKIICESITDKSSFQCTKFMNIEVEVNDTVCVLFTNTDFEKNVYSKNETKSYHTKAGAIIIGIIQKNS